MKLLGDMDQRGIAALMPKTVVENLEVIEIDEQHRRRRAVALATGDHPLKFANHPAAIDRADQRIVMGQPVELFDACFERGDLDPHRLNLGGHQFRIAALARHRKTRFPLSRGTA